MVSVVGSPEITEKVTVSPGKLDAWEGKKRMEREAGRQTDSGNNE